MILDRFQETPSYDASTGRPLRDASGNMIPRITFKERADILIGTTFKLGAGLTLDRTCCLFLVEPMETISAQEQAINRIHRVGQKYECRAILLSTDKVTFEQDVASRILSCALALCLAFLNRFDIHLAATCIPAKTGVYVSHIGPRLPILPMIS